jgi:hypothetical protein
VPGTERFDRLTAGQQRDILGPARYGAFRNGMSLDRMVAVTHHPKYGKGRRLRTLEELGIA